MSTHWKRLLCCCICLIVAAAASGDFCDENCGMRSSYCYTDNAGNCLDGVQCQFNGVPTNCCWIWQVSVDDDSYAQTCYMCGAANGGQGASGYCILTDKG